MFHGTVTNALKALAAKDWRQFLIICRRHCIRKFMCYIIVRLDIFARVVFSRNFAYAKFGENKILAKCGNHSVFY